MYESPITVIAREAQHRFEDDVWKAVLKCDIFVDKQELERALAYDRGQFEAGFAAGQKARHHAKWEITRCDLYILKEYTCSQCGYKRFSSDAPPRFCENCGAEMDSL